MLKQISFRWPWAIAVIASLVLAVVMATEPASATHTLFIVDDDGKAEVGNCNSKTTADESSIQDAIDAAAAGDYVFVCPGTYVEDVEVDKAGLFLLGIANGEKRPVVDGGNKDEVGNGPTINVTADGVTVDNFIVINAGTETPTPGIGVISDNNTITNNVLYGNRCGINLWNGSGGAGTGGGSNNFVAYNTVFENTADGIRVQDESTGNIIFSNDVFDNDSDGIELRVGAADNDLRNNNTHHNFADGIFLRSNAGAGNTLVNNDAHHNATEGIDDDAANHISEAANDTHHNGGTDCDGCVS
ncbi:MAG: right-handed parallel beta-helix repeat-containing protein [Dehalococcoidia bacterium]